MQDTSVTLLLDLLIGATSMHVQATPQHLRQRMGSTIETYTDERVDFLLAAVTTQATDGARPVS